MKSPRHRHRGSAAGRGGEWLRLTTVALITPVLAFAALGLAAVAPAWGADCGKGVGLCRCGDTVVTSTTLAARTRC